MLNRRKHEEHDWGMPRAWRAAIYLNQPEPEDSDESRDELSIGQQLVLCRCVAPLLHAEIVGEFVDRRLTLPSRPGLRQVLELVGQSQRLDYLIVSSRDRLASDCDEAVEVAWRLGLADTVVISADAEFYYPWTGEPLPSRE
jgi:hypothetical protein